MIRTLLLTTTLSLLAVAGLAQETAAPARENYALLIGANEYTNLAERWWLKGPKNDVELVRTYLTTEAPVPFAPENVTVLSDGVPDAVPATLAAIRTAFADLTATVQPGDFVYVHLSGHGTQAPAVNDPTELDGLDELFLPVDIGTWNNTIGTVENALVDDEIGQLVDAIRAKGADVWLVMDSCFSGTGTRAVSAEEDEVSLRMVDPSAFGIDPVAMEDAVSRGLPPADPREAADTTVETSGDAGMGDLVAFFAAQTTEMTPEKNLPKGQPGRKPQGVFTFVLFETLAEYPGATYGQIAQEVLRKYSTTSIAKTTPLFEGDLDQVVFGGEKGERVAQWPATVSDGSFTIPAGELHGLTEGTTLAVMATAADATEAAIGYVTVTALDTFTATAVATEKDGKVLPADLPKGLYLRKLDAALDFTLTVALPPPGTTPADALLAALEALQAEAGPRLNFVAAGAEADLRLAVLPDSPRPEAIWVLPSTGLAEDLTQTPSVDTVGKTGDELAATLADTLGQMAKVLNILKLGAAMGTGTLDVSVELQTRTPEDRTLRTLPFAPVPTLLPDDEVHVLAKNNTEAPVDVNVLYIGADYSITHWFSGRLQPGDELKKGLFAIGGDALGQERMIVVVTPASPQSPVENLSYLAQDALETTRAVGGSAFGDALTEAGFGETTRGAIALSDDSAQAAPAPMILQLEVRTKAAN